MIKSIRHWIAAGLVLAAAGQAQEVLGHWRFEGEAGQRPAAAASTVNTETMPGKLSAEAGGLQRAADVPARYVYDPQAKVSYENKTSLKFAGTAEKTDSIEVPFPAGTTSFTLEMFVKPARDPKRTMWAAVKTRQGAGAASIACGARYLPRWRQTYYAGFLSPGLDAAAIDAGKQPEWREWSTGHYVTISRLRDPNPRQKYPGNLVWRHLALVYDHGKQTVTVYLDRWQVATQRVAGPLTWDAAPIRLGGAPDGKGFEGWIDEVRLTRGVLTPTGFLRRLDQPLAGISFASENKVLPAAMCIDIKAAFGAVGDGKHDDTKAFNRAFAALANKVPGGWYTLFVPAGTYLISDTIHHKRFFVVQGAGPGKTIIKLKDNAKGFQNKKKPKPVYISGWGEWGKWGRGAGNHIGVYLFGFTIDTGKGNPGCVGLDHHSNNIGCVEDITIRSGDGEGYIGLSFVRPWPGPALIKHVKIDGFDYGVKMNSQEYSMTLEHVTLTNQKVAGIENAGNIMACRKIISENRVPAVSIPGANGMMALVDCEFTGGAPDQPAIKSAGGIYVRNLNVDGYQAAIEQRVFLKREKKGRKKVDVWGDTRTVPGPVVEEFVGDRIVSAHGDPAGGIKLPIEETPTLPWGDIETDWVSIDKFAARKDGDDWAPALEAAFASGAKTIYFPHDVTVGRTVTLKGPVQRLIGTCRTEINWTRPIREAMNKRIKAAGRHDLDQKAKEPPAMIFAEPDAERIVIIERMNVVSLKHASPATLVFRHGGPGAYTNAAGCGKLFMEDLGANCFRFDHPQNVWVRQWNPEAHKAGPCIVSKGATIWSLGFKTEYESSKLWAFDGAKTEIVGAFIYPIGKIPKDRPIFKNVNSDLTVQYGTSVYRANHKVHIIDTQNGKTVNIGNDKLKWPGSRARMDLYVSRRAAE